MSVGVGEEFGGVSWGQRGNLVLDCTLEDVLIERVDPKSGAVELDNDGHTLYHRITGRTMKAVLLGVAQFGPECFVSQRRLAASLQMGRRAVQRGIVGLERLGVLEVEQRPGKGAALKTNVMRIILVAVAIRCPARCVDERLRGVLGVVERDGRLEMPPHPSQFQPRIASDGEGWRSGDATRTTGEGTMAQGGCGPQDDGCLPGSGGALGAPGVALPVRTLLGGGGAPGAPGWRSGSARVALPVRSEPMTYPGMNQEGPTGPAGGCQPVGPGTPTGPTPGPDPATHLGRAVSAQAERRAEGAAVRTWVGRARVLGDRREADDAEAVAAYLRERVAQVIARKCERLAGREQRAIEAAVAGVRAEWARKAYDAAAELGIGAGAGGGGERDAWVEWVMGEEAQSFKAQSSNHEVGEVA